MKTASEMAVSVFARRREILAARRRTLARITATAASLILLAGVGVGMLYYYRYSAPTLDPYEDDGEYYVSTGNSSSASPDTSTGSSDKNQATENTGNSVSMGNTNDINGSGSSTSSGSTGNAVGSNSSGSVVSGGQVEIEPPSYDTPAASNPLMEESTPGNSSASGSTTGGNTDGMTTGNSDLLTESDLILEGKLQKAQSNDGLQSWIFSPTAALRGEYSLDTPFAVYGPDTLSFKRGEQYILALVERDGKLQILAAMEPTTQQQCRIFYLEGESLPADGLRILRKNLR